MFPFTVQLTASLLSLVLGSTTTVGGVPVRRATLLGYELPGLGVLSLEEATAALSLAAMMPANDAPPATVARGRVALFGVVFDYVFLGQPGYYRLTNGHGRKARVILTHPGRNGAVLCEETGAHGGPSVAFLSLRVVAGHLEVAK